MPALLFHITSLLASFSFSMNSNLFWVAAGSMLLGGITGMVGTFTFLRKRALVGDAIAHSALPGVCLAFLISGTKNPLWLLGGAFVTGWLSLIIMDKLTSLSKIKTDTAIAAILSVFFGAGILLLTHIQHSGNAAQSGLDEFLFGNAASMTLSDLYTFSAVGAFVIILILLFYKELKVFSFDPEFAGTQGLPTRGLEVMLSTITVLTVAIGIQTVGVVLIAALLISPAAAARKWSKRLPTMLGLSAFFGGSAGIIGTFISYSAPSMPTGPWIVICLFAFVLIALLYQFLTSSLHHFINSK